MFGNNGKILRVNLSNGATEIESYGQEFARAFLGGNGFAAKLIYDSVPADVKPFGEGNGLVFTVGPFTDTPLWGTSRGHIATISPQTNYFADSNFGGDFAVAQKRTGFDAIYITGRAEKPVYLLITEGRAELKSADDYWSMTTEETNLALEQKEGKGSVSISIGPAGENLVVFACVIGGGKRSGAAGRGGMGAVMGSKNLKAVVAKGSLKTQISHPEKLLKLRKEQSRVLKEGTKVFTDEGTPFLVDMINSRGSLCTHNGATETFDFAKDINAQQFGKLVEKNIACYRCPVACGKMVKVPSGKYCGRTLKMPEYETIYALGAMLDNRDIVSIINGNGLCDLYGLDTVTMGVTLSFVAECLEKGIVTGSELGGKVDFANGSEMVELINATAHKEGIGALLALGSAKLAEKFGGDAYKYLYCVKGLEIPGHSARGVRSLSLGYATATRGGSHHDTRPKYPVPDEDPGFKGQAEYNIRSQNYTAVGDSLIMCRFTQERGMGSQFNEVTVNALNFVTGWDVDIDELDTIGERIYNLERLINVRRGLSRDDDTLPWRTMNEPIPAGPAKGRYCSQQDLQKMLDEYYRLRGWTENGIPDKEKLSQLGLK